MSNIDKYKKRDMKRLDGVVTSVSIEKRHKVFLIKHNLNLSELVRDSLDQIMAEEKLKT